MGDFLPVCEADDIPEGRGRGFRLNDREVAVFHAAGAFSALADRCPHAGASLARGWVEDGEVVCPLHRWRFRLSDGQCTAGDEGAISRFPCEVRRGIVWVAV